MGINEAGFERLFQQHYTALVMYAYKLLKQQEEAEEAVQDVFANTWQNRASLNPQGNLKAYLFTATHNRCISMLRKKRLPTVSLDAFYDPGPAETKDIESEADLAELRAAIYQEIQRLPDKCKEVFLLSRWEKMSHRDIARHLGLSLKTVENHIGNAMKRIRQGLFDDDDSPWKGYLTAWLPLLLPLGYGWGESLFQHFYPFFHRGEAGGERKEYWQAGLSWAGLGINRIIHRR